MIQGSILFTTIECKYGRWSLFI